MPWQQFFRRWGVPIALLILLVLSFGLMFLRLGFYWDDWPIMLATRLQGVGTFWEYYGSERPFNPLTVIPAALLLGTRPLNWHVFALLMRWLTVLGLLWSLKGLWPRRGQQAVWIALLFAIYPIFTQQPVAATFTTHWIVYALFFYSLGAMLQAERTPRWRLPLTLSGMLAQLLHMLPLEYFWGLELLRPFMLWLVHAETIPDKRQRLWATLKSWFPYLLVYAGVLIWWLSYRSNLPESNQPDELLSLGATPLQTGMHFVQVILQDTIHNLIGAWYSTIDPAVLDLGDRSVLASLALAVFTAGLTFLFLLRLNGDARQPAGESASPQWAHQAIAIGLLGTLLGPLPIWAIDRQSLVGLQSGRFALAAMTGMSILCVGLLEWFTPRRIPKAALLALMIGLAAGFHLRVATSYYRSTLAQDQFYWQLYWRAPYIKPGTAILSKDELFIYVGRKPTAVTLNLLYPQPFGTRQVGYWFLEMDHDIGQKIVPKLARGKTYDESFRTFDFTGSSLNSLVIFYKPGAGRCLWVLSPDDADNPQLPDLTLQALPVSNLSRIEPQPVSDDYPRTEFFGAEPPHTWCYYFQKSQLAAQFGRWQEVASLGDQAEGQGYTAGNPYEWLPFIQGYAYTGRWEKALERTQAAFDADQLTAPRLCRLWQAMLTPGNQPPVDFNNSFQQLQNLLQCSQNSNTGSTSLKSTPSGVTAFSNIIP
jgi:hypothetical protein